MTSFTVWFEAQQPCPNTSPGGWIVCRARVCDNPTVLSTPLPFTKPFPFKPVVRAPHQPQGRQGSTLYCLHLAVEKTLAQRGNGPVQGYTARVWGSQGSSSSVLSSSNPGQVLKPRMGSFSRGQRAWQHTPLWGWGLGPDQRRSCGTASRHPSPSPQSLPQPLGSHSFYSSLSHSLKRQEVV